jgi:hypothetical protein
MLAGDALANTARRPRHRHPIPPSTTVGWSKVGGCAADGQTTAGGSVDFSMLATGTTMSFSELSGLLWQEREALEMLVFKLVEERLIVDSGHTRWLAAANDEVEVVAGRLRGIEVLRSAAVEELCSMHGLGPGLTLSELAARADEPWTSILLEHLDRLREVVQHVQRAADATGLVERAERPGAASRVAALDETELSDLERVVWEAAAYRAASATLESLRQYSLRDFLR